MVWVQVGHELRHELEAEIMVSAACWLPHTLS